MAGDDDKNLKTAEEHWLHSLMNGNLKNQAQMKKDFGSYLGIHDAEKENQRSFGKKFGQNKKPDNDRNPR